MNQLKEIVSTSSFSYFATRIFDKLPAADLVQDETIGPESTTTTTTTTTTTSASSILFALFLADSTAVMMTTGTGVLLLLFLTSFAKPFSIPSWKRSRLAKQNDNLLKEANGDDDDNTASSGSQPPPPQQWSQLWNDLTSPLTYFMTSNFDDSTSETESQQLVVLTPRPCHVLHFCFLIHGHRGYSQDLDYLSAQMRQVAQAEFDKQDNNDGGCSNGTAQQLHDIVVHAMVCNEKKTTDGVVNGGERAIQEMLEVITSSLQERQSLENETVACQDITISVLGNSLGGVYARYAVAKLAERWNCTPGVDDPLSLLAQVNNRTYRVHYNVFCTTATPHLGIAGHTFFPIPRTAEIGVAHAMGNTGRDLFRLNNLLKDMATSREFLEPLGRFRKRIAYANAYGTDFPVPAHTAAFLSERSTYPHHFNEDDQNEVVLQDNGLIVATLHTPVSSDYSSGTTSPDLQLEAGDDDSDDRDELETMSQALDSLGWKKVFIDVRKEIPRIALPTSFIRKTMTQMTGTEKNESVVVLGGEQQAPAPELIQQLRERGVVGSKDIAAAVTVPLFDEQFHWPMGHNMIVAFSRSKLSTYLNKAGRPVVDALAKALVEDIFAWRPLQPAEQQPSQS